MYAVWIHFLPRRVGESESLVEVRNNNWPNDKTLTQNNRVKACNIESSFEFRETVCAGIKRFITNSWGFFSISHFLWFNFDSDTEMVELTNSFFQTDRKQIVFIGFQFTKHDTGQKIKHKLKCKIKRSAPLSSDVDWFIGHSEFFGGGLLSLLLLRVPEEHDASKEVYDRYDNSKEEAVAITKTNEIRLKMNFKRYHRFTCIQLHPERHTPNYPGHDEPKHAEPCKPSHLLVPKWNESRQLSAWTCIEDSWRCKQWKQSPSTWRRRW